MSSSVPAILLCFHRLETGNFRITEGHLQQAHSLSLTPCCSREPVPLTAQCWNIHRRSRIQSSTADPSSLKEGSRRGLAGNACLGNSRGTWVGVWRGRGAAFLPYLSKGILKENCELVEGSVEILHN